jgi:hypothetical protein
MINLKCENLNLKQLKMKIPFQQILLTLILITSSLSAQVKKEKKENPKQVHLDMKDGNSIDGKLIDRRGDTIVIESTTLGMMNIHIANIKSINDLESKSSVGVKNLYHENRHTPHGYFAPTAFGLRKGEGYYGNFYLFVHHLNYGFTDHFSVEISTETLSLLTSASPFQVVYAVPKFSFNVSKDVNLGVGIYISKFGSFFNRSSSSYLTIPFGVATFGNRDKNLSIGVGTFVSGSFFSSTSSQVSVISLSGQLRLSKDFVLMTENYGFNSRFSNFPVIIGSAGVRFLGKKATFDIGINSIRIPVLGFSFAFGNKK